MSSSSRRGGPKNRHDKSFRSFDHNFDFSVNKEVGIQLTERQVRLRNDRMDSKEQQHSGRPFETRSNKLSHPADEGILRSSTFDVRNESNTSTRGGTARSTASTTVYRSQKQLQDQKALLRKVLASKAASSSSARSSVSTSANNYSQEDRRAFLQRVMKEKAALSTTISTSTTEESKSSVSTGATSSHSIDQKALLRQVLAKTRAKKQQEQQQRTSHKRVTSDAARLSKGSNASSKRDLDEKENAVESITIKAAESQEKKVAVKKKRSVSPDSKSEHAGAADKIAVGRNTLNVPSERNGVVNRHDQRLPQNRDVKTSHLVETQEKPPNAQGAAISVTESITNIRRESDTRMPSTQKRDDLAFQTTPQDSAIPQHGETVKEETRESEGRRDSDRSKRKPTVPDNVNESRKKERRDHSLSSQDIDSAGGSKTNTTMATEVGSFASFENVEANTKPSENDFDSPTPQADNMEDDEGFAEFMKSLQKEVSGDHTELWRSFQTLFYDSSQLPPRQPRQKTKRVQVDEKTKESLATMHLYLKSSSSVECVSETQLVNDKKFLRQQRKQSTTGKGLETISEQPQSQAKSDETKSTLTTRQYLEKARKRLSERKGSARKKAAYSTLGSPGEEMIQENSNYIHTDQGHHNRAPSPTPSSIVSEWPQEEEQIQSHLQHDDPNDRRTSWLTSYRAKKAAQQTSNKQQDVEIDTDSNGQPAWPTLGTADERVVQPTSSEETNNSPTSKPLPWLAALKKRKARQGKQQGDEAGNQRHDEDARSVSAVSDPMVELRRQISSLRSVSVDSEEDPIPIARQRSLLDDDTDDEDEEEYESPKSLSGRKRRNAESFPPSTSNTNPVPAWSSVKLRSGLNNLRGGEESSEFGGIEKARSECGVPWSTVKLRPVSSNDETDGKTSSQQKDDILSFRQMLRRVPSDAIRKRTVPSGVRLGDDAEGKLAAFPPSFLEWSSSRDETDMVEEDVGVNVGDEIDLTNLPSTLFNQEEQAFVMKMQSTPGMPETDSIYVAVGENVLMTVRSNDDDSLSRITWHHARQNVRSLTLDMSENRADLTLSNKKLKSLSFEKIEDCLNFANAFYHTKTIVTQDTNKQVEPPESTSEKEPGTTEPLEKPGSSETKALSEEELKLLETYRLIRQTKAPEEAIRQIMPSSDGSSAANTLSEDEEKIASRFRKMLKFAVPEDAVLHKMTSEKVPQKIIDGVLGSSQPDTSASPAKQDEPSTPSLSEEEEKIASKFRKMLKVNIPAEAVRHKMTMEKVPDKIVQAVLGVEQSSQTNAENEENPKRKLSEEDEKVASKYRKMLQMGVPADGVRHKMTSDQVDSKIVASVMGEDSSTNQVTNEESKPGLSKEEEKTALTYRKMLKMMVPPEAVRHRMVKDQIDPKIVEAVLGPDPNAPKASKGNASTTLSEDEEKIAASYRKMLKMMVPAEAVRHKMTKDKVDNKIVVAVLGPDKNDAGKPDSGKKLSYEDEKIAIKYRLMLKRMVPVDAVRHRMEKEQIHPRIIKAVLEPEEKKEKDPNALTDDEENIAATYRKMLKMSIPKEAVRHKMVRDGVKEKIIAAVLGDKTKAPESSKKAAKGSKLVALHWTPLSGEELDNSVWRASKKRKVEAEGSDFSKLLELFQKKSNPKGGKGTAADGSSGNGNGEEMAKLIDLNRANNVAISLKAFKDFTRKELAQTIAHLDPRRMIQGERCQFISDLLPNASEMKTIQGYKGPEKKLVPAELFFRELVNIQRLEIKVRVMQTMETFTENASQISSQFQILNTVCNQVMQSEKLQDVLEMVLQVGNIMNEGTRTGGAAGFKFDSLLKLTQTKSSDGKTTVLDYIVMTFMAKNGSDTLDLTGEFPEVQTAGRMALSDMIGDVKDMNGALNQCRTELVNMKKDNSAKPVTRSMSKKFGGPAGADPRSALLAAIKAKGSDEEEKTKSISEKRDQFLAATKEKKHSGQTSSVGQLLKDITTCGQLDNAYVSGDVGAKQETASPRSKMLSSIKAESVRKVKAAVEESKEKKAEANKSGSVDEGIQRLESFVEEANTIYSKVESDRDAALSACKELSKYCGESGGDRAAVSLLGILSQFVIYLNNAVQKYKKQEEAKARREAAMKKRESQQQKDGPKNQDTKAAAATKDEQQPNKPKSPRGGEKKGPSLVLMVNDMLHSASDQAKQDFAKGVVYERTTDSRLKTIYERERNSLGGVLMSQGDGRESILNAIKKRRKNDEDEENTTPMADIQPLVESNKEEKSQM